jgi:folate-dependent phosphoribosylglycinamide formyltransferase PurN
VTLRLGWFSTGRGEGSRGLLLAALDAIDRGGLDARLEFVFCNRENGQAEGSDQFLALVRARGIPLVAFSSQRFRKEHGGRPWAELREDYDRAAIELLRPYQPDVSVNAGYMLIAPVLCRVHRMINLHPALPGGPAGTWQQVIWELIARRASQSGAMVHVVTEELDAGPVISFCRFPVRGAGLDQLWVEAEARPVAELKEAPGEGLPLFKAIRQAGIMRERPLLVHTLVAIAEGRLSVAGAGTRPAADLTEAVERAVSGAQPG